MLSSSREKFCSLPTQNPNLSQKVWEGDFAAPSVHAAIFWGAQSSGKFPGSMCCAKGPSRDDVCNHFCGFGPLCSDFNYSYYACFWGSIPFSIQTSYMYLPQGHRPRCSASCMRWSRAHFQTLYRGHTILLDNHVLHNESLALQQSWCNSLMYRLLRSSPLVMISVFNFK